MHIVLWVVDIQSLMCVMHLHGNTFFYIIPFTSSSTKSPSIEYHFLWKVNTIFHFFTTLFYEIHHPHRLLVASLLDIASHCEIHLLTPPTIWADFKYWISIPYTMQFQNNAQRMYNYCNRRWLATWDSRNHRRSTFHKCRLCTGFMVNVEPV